MASLLELSYQFLALDSIREPNFGGAIDELEGCACPGEMLPDKLQHEQFVKIRIEQGPSHRVQIPIVVMRPLCKVHDHRGSPLYHIATCSGVYARREPESMPSML